MLRKPGEYDPSRSAASRAYSSNRRKAAEENPDDVARKLQRLPGNKKCADCSAKLPQAVNLTHGTFVCLTCSGVHREFYHRIKGVGHSAFTSEEVSFLSDHGNDMVNAKYMKNYKPTLEVLKPPDGSTSVVDEQFIRVWLRRKYVDKAWVSKDEVGSTQTNNGGGRESRHGGGTNLQPTRVQIPPKTKSSTPSLSAPTGDLLGGFIESKAPIPSPSPTLSSPMVPHQQQGQQPKQTFDDDDAWDAFGRQRESCSVPSFQADFSTNFSQPTMVVHEQKEVEQVTLKPTQPTSFQPDFGQIQVNAPHPSLLNVTVHNDEMKVEESALNQINTGSNTTQPTSFQPDFGQMQVNAPHPSLFNVAVHNDVRKMEEPALYQNTGSNSNPTAMEKGGNVSSADPFDAFNHLHISHPMGGELNHVQNSQMDMNNGFHNQASSSQIKFEVGQKLQYRDSQHNISIVEVVKVHLDQDLVPFYDIKMENGWEKQTDNNHLSIPSQNTLVGGNVHQIETTKESKDELVGRICNFIHTMNEEQLLHVDRFIRDIVKADI